MKPLVDINQVSKFTGISVSTLYKLTANDAIPLVRIGRRVLFRQEDIEEFIASHSVETQQEDESVNTLAG